MTTTDIKQMVKEKYSEIATRDKTTNETACCGSGCCTTDATSIMNENYESLEGYNPDADLGLGCGLPTQFAKIKKGDTVVDLGSGAGNDAFIARHETGETGRVVGIDFTDAMIDRARRNAEVRGFTNVEFREGDIEAMPLDENFADVVVSNCVLNLVPNKAAVMSEIYRVLKPGAHFSISDIVLEGELPKEIRDAAEMYAGCVSGATQKANYLQLIASAGFKNIIVQKEKQIVIPDDILQQYLSGLALETFKKSKTGITSVTIYAEKPVEVHQPCCGSECCN
jgi:arsenite methyltransferase